MACHGFYLTCPHPTNLLCLGSPITPAQGSASPSSRLHPDSPDSSGLASRCAAKQRRTTDTAGQTSPAMAQRLSHPQPVPAVASAQGQWLTSLPCCSPEAGRAQVLSFLACCPGPEAAWDSWVTLSTGTFPPGHPVVGEPCLGIPLLAEKLAAPFLPPLFSLGRGTGLGKVSKVPPVFSQAQ